MSFVCVLFVSIFISFVWTDNGELRCPEIQLDNGHVLYFGDRKVNSFAFFSCEQDFDIDIFTFTTVCTKDHQWEKIPKCVARLRPWAPKHGNTSTADLIANSQSYMLSCAVGFMLFDVFRNDYLRDSLYSVVVTNFNGNLIYNFSMPVENLECREGFRCPDVSYIENGRSFQVNMQVPDNAHQSVIVYICDRHYFLEGNDRRVCQTDGTWSGQMPNCSTIKCPDASFIANGRSFQESCPKLENTYQSVIEYTCDDSYVIDGDSRRECQADGTWSGPMPKCRKITCGALNPPSNGRRLDDNYKIGSFAMFACNPGYELRGSSRLLCRVDGEWSPREPPHCIPVKCPDVSYIENGRSFQQNWQRPENTYQSDIVYSCYEGYVIDGNARRVCQADGTWSGRIPQCIKPRCPDITLGNGTVTYFGDREIYTFAFFKCDENFDLSSVSRTECEENQIWAEIPKCIPRLEPWAPENGYTSTNALVKNGESYALKCNTGFVFFDVSQRDFLRDSLYSVKVKNILGALLFDRSAVSNLKCEDVRAQPWSPKNGYADRTRKLLDQDSYNAICEKGFLFVYIRTHTFLDQGVTSVRVKNVLGDLKLLSYPDIAYQSLECIDAQVSPWSPKNGTADTEKLVKHGDEYQVSCIDGFKFFYLRSGMFEPLQSSLKVQNKLGQLEFKTLSRTLLNDIECRDVRCPAPTVENGQLFSGGRLRDWKYNKNYLTHGDEVLIKCNDGYKLYNRTNGLLLESKEFSITCRFAKISPDTPPECIILNNCQADFGNYALATKGNGTRVEEYEDVQHGTRIHLECEDDIRLQPNEPDLKCYNGDWRTTDLRVIGNIPTCTPVSCQAGDISGGLLFVNNTEVRAEVPHKTIGEVRCLPTYNFAEGRNSSVQCTDGVWVPDTGCFRLCPRPSIENATIEPNNSTFSDNEQITVACTDGFTSALNTAYDYEQPNSFMCKNGKFDGIENYQCNQKPDTADLDVQEPAFESENESLSNTTHTPRNESAVSSTQGLSKEAFTNANTTTTVAATTSAPVNAENTVDLNQTKEKDSCTLEAKEQITYWHTSESKQMSEGETVPNGARVRVKLVCPQSVSYSMEYTSDEATNDETVQDAEILCIDGVLADHGMSCESEEVFEINSTPETCQTIRHGNITDRGRSVECKPNYKLEFINGMDASLYARYSCTCNQSAGRIECMGIAVECKPIGCTIPANVEQGLIVYDPTERQTTSSANRYGIKHGDFLIFNCTPSEDTYYEPRARMFVCDKGSWITKQRSNDKPWNLGNNGSFPECRPVICPNEFCKFGGHCIRDYQCECPKQTKGKHCEEPVCSNGCRNGGTCIAPDTCKCLEGFQGTSCENAGCAKPGDNLINLDKSLYYHGETITITNRNCAKGYFLSVEHKTVTCTNAQWSEDVYCVKAVCTYGCRNGGSCVARDTCECLAGFHGTSCEFGQRTITKAGCAQPEGNLINLERQLYYNGETIRISERNCEEGYLPSSGGTTIACSNGQWSEKIRCVQGTYYTIRIATADERFAGTDGHVHIQLKGKHGDTENIPLHGQFEQNTIDDYYKHLPDVGTIISVDLGVTRRGLFYDGWIPSHVTIYDHRRKYFYLFEHDKTEVNNASITLSRTGCPTSFTVERGYLKGDRGAQYKARHFIESDFECMMMCREHNCVQAEYMTNHKYCGIDTSIRRPVTEKRDDAVLVLTPVCGHT